MMKWKPQNARVIAHRSPSFFGRTVGLVLTRGRLLRGNQAAVASRQGHAHGQKKELLKMIYHRRWWAILFMAVQRAVALNLLAKRLGANMEVRVACEEKLLCAVVVPLASTRVRLEMMLLHVCKATYRKL